MFGSTNSLKVFGPEDGSRGLMDIYLSIGLENAYKISYYVYVPSENSAYMNVQGALNPGNIWAFDIVFYASGEVLLSQNEVRIAVGEYNLDKWNAIVYKMDPITSRAEVWVNNVYIKNFEFNGIIGGLYFFGYGDGQTQGLYYIDNIVITEIDAVDVPAPDNEKCSGNLIQKALCKLRNLSNITKSVVVLTGIIVVVAVVESNKKSKKMKYIRK